MIQFGPFDDGLHESTGDFYENETYWFSFFVPERAIGGWIYTNIRSAAGVSGGGLWIWDEHSMLPWQAPFFEEFRWLKVPAVRGPERVETANGMTIVTRTPLLAYDVEYRDRDRVEVAFTFDALEPPVPLRSGTPPYPKAHHFDQTGRVVGSITLDGERIALDCYAMRDRSWGRRTERGYPRIGYTWAADATTSFLTYSLPDNETDHIHTGYLRRDGEVSHIADGHRRVERDPQTGVVTAMTIEAVDERGRELRASGVGISRLVLPSATAVCINTSMRWTIDGETVHGEDQDVWPTSEFRRFGATR
jgi:hypothetical protein